MRDLYIILILKQNKFGRYKKIFALYRSFLLVAAIFTFTSLCMVGYDRINKDDECIKYILVLR